MAISARCCGVLWCVTVCCSALLCCSALQYVVVCAVLHDDRWPFPPSAAVLLNALRVLQCVAVCCSVLQCGAVRCSALQCVAVHCSALQCVAVRCSALQCVAVRCCAPRRKSHFTSHRQNPNKKTPLQEPAIQLSQILAAAMLRHARMCICMCMRHTDIEERKPSGSVTVW